MFRKHFHWVEGLIVVALLYAVTWLNNSQAAPDSFSARDTYENRSNPKYSSNNDEPDQILRLIREGTVISGQTGYFRQDGDSAIFVTDDDYELRGLPNLNLERVVRTLKTEDETQTIRWRVSGTVTEFSGRNYLFITRAIYKSAAQPPAPEQLNTLSTGGP